MSGVFVSYNREDLEIAQKVVDSLVNEGFDVWMDMNLQAGENYDEITEERLHSASAVVVLWSSRSVKSRWVRAEATIGARKNTLVPVMIEECDRPVMFELIQSTDLTGWNGDTTHPHWRAVVDVVRKRIAAAPPAPLFAETGMTRGKGGGAKGGKAAKAAKSNPKPRKPEKRGMGILGKIAAVFVLAAVAFGGVWALRPDLVQPLLASLPALVPPPPGSADETTATETAALATGAQPLSNTATTLEEAEPVVESTEPEPETAQSPVFSECDLCPVMINVTGGVFVMGSPEEELGRSTTEGPQRRVAMAPYAIGVTEVTYDQWDACVADGGCGAYSPAGSANGRGSQPVALVSWRDAQTYTAWLTKKTGRPYRLPSEAEWEYAARAGSVMPFWWGALYDATKAAVGDTTQAVDQLKPNDLGLYGLSGNVREWVQDCYVNTFAGAPLDGRSVEVAGCKSRVVRGGAHNAKPEDLRTAARSRNDPIYRDRYTGFRVAAAP